MYSIHFFHTSENYFTDAQTLLSSKRLTQKCESAVVLRDFFLNTAVIVGILHAEMVALVHFSTSFLGVFVCRCGCEFNT